MERHLKLQAPAFLAVFLLSLAAWAEDRAAGPVSSSMIDQRLIKTNQRIEIHPIHPKKGITNGLVIAYGHRVEPPYVLEYKDDKLFVNGVQVKPSLVDERESVKEQAQSNDDEALKGIANIADRVVSQIQNMARGGRPKEEILDFANHQNNIEDAKFEADNYMMITISYQGQHWPWGIEMPKPHSRPTAPPQADSKGRPTPAEQYELAWLEKSLSQGLCVIFLSDGGISQKHLTKAFPTIIKLIMNDPKLNEGEKFRRLKNEVFSGVAIAALDVVANYSKDEWAQK